MLLKNKTIEGIQSGKTTLIFRRWKKAGVKKGGTQMTQKGVVGIDDIRVVTEDQITESDAKKAGFKSKDELLAQMYDRDEDIYKIKVHWVGEDPRKALRTNDKLTQKEIDEIIGKLEKFDRDSQRGQLDTTLPANDPRPAKHPRSDPRRTDRTHHTDIQTMGPQTKSSRPDRSLRPGYRLSPRGQKVLAALRQKK